MRQRWLWEYGYSLPGQDVNKWIDCLPSCIKQAMKMAIFLDRVRAKGKEVTERVSQLSNVSWVRCFLGFRFDNFKFQILVLIKLRTFLLTWTLVDADRETLKENFGNAYLNSIVHEKYNIFPIDREISYFTYVGFQNHIFS